MVYCTKINTYKFLLNFAYYSPIICYTGNNLKYRVKVWHTHPTVWLLKDYSQRILTYYTHFIFGRKIRIIRVFDYWT